MKNVISLNKRKQRHELFLELIETLQQYDLSSVALAAEVHYSTLCNWLYGDTISPQLRTIMKVAPVIGLELSFTHVVSARGVM